MIDSGAVRQFVDDRWAADVMPTLTEYATMPCVSPAFEPDWHAFGHMDAAVDLLGSWAEHQFANIPAVDVDVLRLPRRTPALLVSIPAAGANTDEPVLIYGHPDKQPAMEGCSANRSARVAVLENDKLYGRGGADDGYAILSAILAILALERQGVPRPRCLILIEASEESGLEDLPVPRHGGSRAPIKRARAQRVSASANGKSNNRGNSGHVGCGRPARHGPSGYRILAALLETFS